MRPQPDTVWVLTRELNAYDQYGAYFVAVFGSKPTAQALREFILYDDAVIDHLLVSGGGRRGVADEWFHLEEHQIKR